MSEQVVLITGAKGGLGRSVTTAFLAAGAFVAGSSRGIAQTDFPHPNFLAIPPGTIDTPANRAWGSPEERAKWVSPESIAKLALFLVSDAAAEITGAAIPIYGGGA